MHFCEVFIRRPVGTALLMLALFLTGAVALRFLPVAPLPQIEFPTIVVSASLPGASPETMSQTVAGPRAPPPARGPAGRPPRVG
ncbi:MAG: efflux RND transporter permease subunit, partial [Rhodospirillales bacterium]|nr:efflux RND transporter permease subunit [Rhodospirillales bacterium]